MSELKRIQVGETLQGFPANTWNQLCDAHDRQRVHREPRGLSAGSPGVSPRIANMGGAIDVGFGILFACEPINTPAERPSAPYEGLHLCGEHPTQPLIDDGASWVILQEPAPANRAVPFVAVGQSWVQIDVQDEADTTAGPVAGETDHLKSGEGEAVIEWKEPGIGLKWARVRLGGGGEEAKVAVLCKGKATSDAVNGSYFAEITKIYQGSGFEIKDIVTCNDDHDWNIVTGVKVKIILAADDEPFTDNFDTLQADCIPTGGP